MNSVPRYVVPFDTRLLAQVFCDVLVIGTGVTGHVAALEAAAGGARVLALTKAAPLESNTRYAQAGIAAPLSSADSVEMHVADTMRAGDGLCHPRVVELVVSEAAEAVQRLADLGVGFDRAGDEDAAADSSRGGLSLGREGGHSVRRVAHADGDATGAEIQRALSAALLGQDGIRVFPDAFVVDLLTVDHRCVGALVHFAGELRVVWAAATVLASGGAGRLFRESTNPSVSTGDGLAMAYRAGARLRDMEFMQFHPTVLYVPGAPRTLLSEAARGEGAHVLDVRGHRFLPDYDERGELAPRDVVSRAIVTHMLEHGDTHVLLDLRHVPSDRVAGHLPGVAATGRSVGLDVGTHPLPVRPAAHYTLGGVVCDVDGRTNLEGLFAAGEVTSSGLHGANRLASNSLLEGAVMGRRAGRTAAARSSERSAAAHTIVAAAPGPSMEGFDAGDLVRSVESVLWRNAGVRRDGEGLESAAAQLADWSPLVLERSLPLGAGSEAQNLCLLARLLVDAAARREETRGVHWRVDHPARDDSGGLGHYVQERGRKTRFEPLESAAKSP